jgi:type III secretion protein F
MSSTGPSPQRGVELVTRSMDVLRRQQQETLRALTLAQQQAAETVAIKTPPSPQMTIEALQARLKDQVATFTTTFQALGQAVAQGNTTPLQMGMIAGQMQGALDRMEQDLLALGATVDAPTVEDLLQMQRAMSEWSLAVTTISTVMKEMSDTLKGVIQKLG